MKKFIILMATGLGSGYSPVASGTAGSVVGLLLYWLLRHLAFWPYLVTVVGLIVFAVWVSGEAEIIFAQKDSGKIVIDEIVGILVTLVGIAASWKTVVAGFFLFRLFDIWKPYPARICQDKLKGGWGVVMDDVVAGILANLVLQIITRIYPGL